MVLPLVYLHIYVIAIGLSCPCEVKNLETSLLQSQKKADDLYKSLQEAKVDVCGKTKTLKAMKRTKKVADNIYVILIDSDIFKCDEGSVELKDKLGDGTFGCVYKCVYKGIECACKILKTCDTNEINYEVAVLLALNTCAFTPMVFGYSAHRNAFKTVMLLLTNYVGWL